MIAKLLATLLGARRYRRVRERFAALGRIDETLLVARLLRRNGAPRVMIDVGAHHGESLAAFAAAGWTVHAFEPDPDNVTILEGRCAQWPDVHVWPQAVAERDGATATFFRNRHNSFLGSLLPAAATAATGPPGASGDSAAVATVSLDGFCTRHGIGAVGFLKIDAEGADLQVLAGWGSRQPWPTVVQCEFDGGKVAHGEPPWPALAEFLAAADYSIIVSEWAPITSYDGPFIWRRFFVYPGNLLDPRAAGNLIAVRDRPLFARLCRLARAMAGRHRLVERSRALASR